MRQLRMLQNVLTIVEGSARRLAAAARRLAPRLGGVHTAARRRRGLMSISMARIAHPLADIETGHAPAAVAAAARERVLILNTHANGGPGLLRALRRPC